MKSGLSNSTLKIIALFTMLADHIGAIFVFNNTLTIKNLPIIVASIGILLRVVGRIAFTLYSFLLVEGYLHTHNKIKYFIRLLVLAIIAECPFDLFFNNQYIDMSHQNTVFTLVIGFIAITLIEKFSTLKNNKYLLQISCVGFLAVLAELLSFDYGFFGVIFICCLYFFKDNNRLRFTISSIPLLFCGLGQIIGAFGFIFISKYNNSKGSNSKYLFYVFYPLHLIILYIIKVNFIQL